MAIGCIISMIIDLKTMKVSTRLINSLSLRDLRTYLIRQKRQRTIQLIVELPLAMAWLVWFLLSLLGNSMALRDMNDPTTVGWIKFAVIIATAIIALVVIILVYRNSQRINDSMIKEIDSLE